METYSAPVAALLKRGQPKEQDWLDYRTLGITPEHIEELSRLVGDPVGYQGDPDSPEVWGPVHAWRAVASLRALEAVPALLSLVQRQDMEHDDLVAEEIPRVLVQIGPAVLPHLESILLDPAWGVYPRWTVADTVVHLVQAYPERREEGVAILSAALEQALSRGDELSVNAVLIGSLTDLHAVEAFPLMDRAFAANQVETTICGDREWIRYELGLRPDQPPRRIPPEGRFPGQGRRNQSPAARAQERKLTRRREAKKAKKRKKK